MIRADWFEFLPERAWQNWFWLRVSKVLKARHIQGTNFDKVRRVVLEVDQDIKKKIVTLFKGNREK
ncbi:MAG: hypothetical protein RPR28_01040 [Cycloclasticus sp.]